MRSRIPELIYQIKEISGIEKVTLTTNGILLKGQMKALANPTDTPTLVPFLEDMGQHLSFKYMNIVADAGYESEENYSYIEEHGQFAYIKPSNYEISKTRKYQADISNRENMVYDEEKDCYRCSQGNLLKAAGSKQRQTASGYIATKVIYKADVLKETIGKYQNPSDLNHWRYRGDLKDRGLNH